MNVKSSARPKPARSCRLKTAGLFEAIARRMPRRQSSVTTSSAPGISFVSFGAFTL